MADVLFGDDVSEDSDWGDDEPSTQPSVDAAASESDNQDNNVRPDPVVPALAQSTEAESGSAGATKEEQAIAQPNDASETTSRLEAVDVAGSASYAAAENAVGVAEVVDGDAGGTFYLIGLGLGDEKDITVNGLEIVRRCKRVFLEHYTAVLGVHGTQALEKFYGRPVEVADRTMVEQGSDTIFEAAVKGGEVAMLVVGDPFGATTHTDMFLRAHELGLRVQVIHNASIMNAVGCTGLQLYRFGHCVSICFFRDEWRPTSFYEKVLENRKTGLHTLCLLDIKVKEPDFQHLIKTGKERNLPPRFMTVNQCLRQMMEVEEEKKKGAYSWDSIAVGVARVGQRSQCIKSGTIRQLVEHNFGAPLHSVIIVGEVDEIEEKMLKHFALQ